MSDDKEYKSGCRCGGMCGMCHEDAPKSKEEKIAHLEKKESKLKKMLEHVQKMKESVTTGTEMDKEE